jgi:hypothetical protein
MHALHMNFLRTGVVYRDMFHLPIIAVVVFWSMAAAAEPCDAYGAMSMAVAESHKAAAQGDIRAARAVVAKARNTCAAMKNHSSSFDDMVKDIDLAEKVHRDVCTVAPGWRVSTNRFFTELMIVKDPVARDDLAAMLSATVTADGAVVELTGVAGAAGMQNSLRKQWPTLAVVAPSPWTLQYTMRSCVGRPVMGLTSDANRFLAFECDGSAVLSMAGRAPETVALAGSSSGTTLALAARSRMPGADQVVTMMQQAMLSNAEQRLCNRPIAAPLPVVAPPSR